MDGPEVTLDKTIFYAFSGGQESDHGTIGGIKVIDATKRGLDIVYTLEAAHELHAGDSVDVKIDWHRRYSPMKNHFAAELILELVYQSLGDVEKIGAHISSDKARIDFFWPENISAHFEQFLERAKKIVHEDLEIISAYENEAAQERYWEVKGFAKVPCGGTHLKRTGEIGEIRLKRKNIGSGKERIEIFTS